MDFSISQTTQDLSQRVRDFVRDELFPLEPRIGQEPFAQLLPELRAKREHVRRLGLWTPQISQTHGGVGLGFMDYAMVSEQLGQSPLGHYVFNAQAPDAGNMEILIEYGTGAQKTKWLEPLLEGEIRSCFSMTEPDRPGSNPVWLETRAVRDGNAYVIDGHKWFTTAADGAAFAIVMVVTDPDAPPHARASQVIVPTGTPGFEIVRNIPCMGHAGDDWASHSEIRYTGCRVPVANRIGEEGAGFTIAQSRLGPGRVHHCMRWIGVAERCFDLLCRHTTTREVVPGKPLATQQTVQHWIADSRTEIDAARLLTLNTAWKIDRWGANQARAEISGIKFFVADVMNRTIDRAIQAHGALGISDDTVLSFFYRNERGARIYDGPDEVHRNVVARQVLKQYGFDPKKQHRSPVGEGE